MIKQAWICAIGIVVSVNASAQTKNERAVEAAVAQLRTAMVDGDSSLLDRLVRNELSYAHSSGKIEDKSSFVSALASGRSDFLTMEIGNQTITVVDKTAVVRHQLTGQVVDNGKQGNVKLHVVQVWVKGKGGWRMLARQAVKLP